MTCQHIYLQLAMLYMLICPEMWLSFSNKYICTWKLALHKFKEAGISAVSVRWSNSTKSEMVHHLSSLMATFVAASSILVHLFDCNKVLYNLTCFSLTQIPRCGISLQQISMLYKSTTIVTMNSALSMTMYKYYSYCRCLNVRKALSLQYNQIRQFTLINSKYLTCWFLCADL